MVLAIDPNEERAYILKCDRKNGKETIPLDVALKSPDENATIFYYKPIPYGLRAKMRDDFMEGRMSGKEYRTTFKSGTEEKEILLGALTRVENFKLPNGEEKPYPENNNRRWKEEWLTHLEAQYCAELANYIWRGSDVTEDEEENLD